MGMNAQLDAADFNVRDSQGDWCMAGRKWMAKVVSVFLAAGMMLSNMTIVKADHGSDAVEEAKSYTYEVHPIISWSNEYLYVKTDNMNVSNLRFVDTDSKYLSGADGEEAAYDLVDKKLKM